MHEGERKAVLIGDGQIHELLPNSPCDVSNPITGIGDWQGGEIVVLRWNGVDYWQRSGQVQGRSVREIPWLVNPVAAQFVWYDEKACLIVVSEAIDTIMIMTVPGEILWRWVGWEHEKGSRPAIQYFFPHLVSPNEFPPMYLHLNRLEPFGDGFQVSGKTGSILNVRPQNDFVSYLGRYMGIADTPWFTDGVCYSMNQKGVWKKINGIPQIVYTCDQPNTVKSLYHPKSRLLAGFAIVHKDGIDLVDQDWNTKNQYQLTEPKGIASIIWQGGKLWIARRK